MSGGARVLLWRHGRSTWNLQRRFQGQSDAPLDEAGTDQARRAAAMIAALEPAGIVSSDLSRAVQTARPLAELTGLPVRTDPRLRERSLGRWEGLTRDEVAAEYPQEFRDWLAGREDFQAGSEPRSELADRALAAATDALADGDPNGGPVVLVTHSATAIALTGRLLGLPMPAWRALGPLTNCHWSELRRDDHGWRLRAHNVGPAGPVVPAPVVLTGGGEAGYVPGEPADAEALDAGPPAAAAS